MLVIFPFGSLSTANAACRRSFVGHPLAELPQPSISRRKRSHAMNPPRADRNMESAVAPAAATGDSRNLPEMLEAA